MPVTRSLAIILACAGGFGFAGGWVGLTLGRAAPSYYYTVFRVTRDSPFQPAQVGLGLGLTQGLGWGVLVGCVIVLAAAWGRPASPKTPDRPPAPNRWWAGIFLGLIVTLVVASISALAGFYSGVMLAYVDIHFTEQEKNIEKMRALLAEFPYRRVQATSGGDESFRPYISGQVDSEPIRQSLHDRLAHLFGDETAGLMVEPVEIVPSSDAAFPANQPQGGGPK